MEEITLQLNGELRTAMVEKSWTLLYVLRDCFDLTGAKCGCSTGDCGACRVLIDGESTPACLILAHKAQGKRIETIEGLSGPEGLHPLQRAFIECGAIQCGYCTPGMILSAKALLDKTLSPTVEEIRQALAHNLCRCTGYVKIVAAVQTAAQFLRGETER